MSCFLCGGTGLRVVSRAGDPVPGYPQNGHTRTVFASTTYVTCDCRIVRLGPISPSLEVPAPTRFERVVDRA